MYKKPRKKVIGAGTLITLVENIKNLKMLQKVLSSIFIQLLCYHKKLKKLRKSIKKYTFSVKKIHIFCKKVFILCIKVNKMNTFLAQNMYSDLD